ncbi:hypothetical protein [Carnobacterium maltaromaticum]|nr:hypothetical protein [Carnobacterium maltaromaticum]
MDVKTSSGGWETMRSSVGNVVGKGAWGKGVIDDLKDITKNLEKAEEKISAKDEDGVVSFHHLDRTTTYQEIYEKMEVLYGFTNKAHDLVDETIDEKFYQEIDKYAVVMRDLTINKYSTKNITGATKQELVFTSSSMQEMQTVSKDKITVDDLFSDSSPLGKKMKADFDQYRLSQGDKEIKYEDFKQSMLNTGAFEYTSIKDKQMKKEMWVNLGIAAVVVIASIAFPPAGMALGLVVSSLEVGSAITGKDWVSGRELGTGERVFRGVLGGVGLGTELYALNSFSKNVRLASQIKYGGEGATSVQHLGDMVANSGKSSYGRVTEFGNSVKLANEGNIASNVKYSGDFMDPIEAARYDEYWRNAGIGSNTTWEDFVKANPKSTIDDYFRLIKEQSPWPDGYVPNEATLKSGGKFEMALSSNQPASSPGRFGTTPNTIEDIEYVRNNLAVKQEWKPDVGKVVLYEVKEGAEIPILKGPVGPQVDLTTNTYLNGGADQVQILFDREKNMMDYLNIINVKPLK